MRKLDLHYFFSRPHIFPWYELGFARPSFGAPHSYLCYILAPYVDQAWADFMRNKPAFFELQRAARDSEDRGMADIVRYCEAIYNQRKDDRVSVAVEVLGMLSTHSDFKDFFEATIWRLHSHGNFNIPKEAIF